MNKTERLFKIEQIIATRAVVPFKELLDELEVSRATLKRDLEYLRSRMQVPIVYDREANGYRMDLKAAQTRAAFPGLWFNGQEAAALMTMQHLLTDLQPGMLRRHIEPLKARFESMLETTEHPFREVRRRVRILNFGRPPLTKTFETATNALLGRKQLRISYYSRSKDKLTERTISPQRLVCFRENWYLEAWCHMRKALRSFAVECIRHAEALSFSAKEIPDEELDKLLAAGYGVFAAEVKWKAKLKFSPVRARWVAAEQWHPRQRAKFEADGSYVLEFPYSSDRDLIGDILRYGPEVEVLEPKKLRDRCRNLLLMAAGRYD